MNSIKVVIATLCLVLGLSGNLVAADTCPAFDKFSDVNCEDLSARLDNFAVALGTAPDARATIIVYEGKYRNGKAPRHGEAQANASRIKDYLVNSRGVSPARIAVVNGGFRDDYAVELWICPQGVTIPVSPTRTATDMKFRKGKISKREYKWSCL
jgi:hypothetical protein